MTQTHVDLMKVCRELQSACHVIIAMDCWSKKGLTASFLAISAAFFSPIQNCPVHVFLNLHRISHPHTGAMLATKLELTLSDWKITRGQILMVATDGGSNMLKAVRSVKLVVTDGADSENEDDGTDDEMNQSDSTSDTESEVEEVVGLQQFPCVAHTLQLVLKINTHHTIT